MDSRITVVTVRSVTIGVAAGTSVAAMLGLAVGTPWGLAALTGFAAGVCGVAIPVTMRDGRFDIMGSSVVRRHWRIYLLAYGVVVPPMFFIDDVMALRPPVGLSLALLFGLTGTAAYLLGGTMATLDHLEGNDVGNDSRILRVTPSRGNERSPS